MIQNSNLHIDAPKESREFKAPQIDQTSLTGKCTSFSLHVMLYPHQACPNASFGFFYFLWNCLLFLHPSLLWLPRLILKKTLLQSGFHWPFIFSSPWITFSSIFYFVIQGMTKEAISPSVFMGVNHMFLTFFFSCSWYIPDMSSIGHV